MKEAENTRDSFPSDANIKNTEASHETRKETHEAQMMEGLSNDDLLDEENDLSDAAYTFLGVQKGNSVEVRNAATLAASAPARLSSRPSGKLVNTVYMTQKITQSSCVEKSEALASATMGTTQRPIETLPGTEQGAKGLDTQAAVELQLGRRSLLLSGSRLE